MSSICDRVAHEVNDKAALIQEGERGLEYVRARGALRQCLYGSALVVDNPVDIDVLVEVLVDDIHEWIEQNMGEVAMCSPREYNAGEDRWVACRRGDVNFIITNDPEFYELSLRAQAVVEALHLTEKDDRKTVFRLIVDTEYA